jgi:hypothetical protein
MKERALQFGPDRRLIGILTLPDEVDPGRPAVLIPNTGVEHRVGPNRLHIHLCRALARLGLVSLRLDLSGMGDSGSPGGGSRGDPVEDLRAAMERLERMHLATRFAVIGLCSGGNDAHRLARIDARVVAAAFVDHYQYRTPRAFAIQLAQKLSEPRRALNLLRRKWNELTRRPRSEYDPELVSFFEQPPRDVFIDDVRGFARRGVALFFLYTGENQNAYNYAGQLYDVVPALRDYPLQVLHYVPRCDHTFTHERMRGQLIEALEHWFSTRVLAGAGGAVAKNQEHRRASEPAPAEPLQASSRQRACASDLGAHP